MPFGCVIYRQAPNETVEKTLVRKMFKKISHNRLKNCQNAVWNTKNKVLFRVSLPLSKNNFWKVTYSTVSTAGVTGKRGSWREKPPDAESASWGRLLESVAERPHLSGARGVGRRMNGILVG
jgi:hypothetical protein